MTLNRQICAGVAMTLLVAAAHAEWKGKGEAGVVFARGNTDADTINLKLAMSEEIDQWKHTLEMAALRASSNGVQSANRYLVGWQSDYKISARSFAFGGLRYENDKFSGFAYQATASTGLGYKFYDTDKIKLAAQVGAGYRRTKDNVTDATSGNAVLVAGMDYENAITATTKVVDKLHLESGSDDTLLSNFIGLEVKMSTSLALAVGIDARDNTKPPPGKKQLDTVTTVNLVYAF